MRKEGFYWVKLMGGEWIIAYYLIDEDFGNRWYASGDKQKYYDRDFAEIDENQITR